jgi:hypothetical protein
MADSTASLFGIYCSLSLFAPSAIGFSAFVTVFSSSTTVFSYSMTFPRLSG